MKRKLILSLLLFSCMTIQAQRQAYKGYPSRDGDVDLPSCFRNPPKGYGNVPFYWWNGDTLKRERLAAQLSLLGEACTDGLAVSYIHTHPQVDVELNAHGYGRFGRADAGVPGVFTEEWWQLWNRFSAQCADQGIGLGLDDYVLGWAGNGFYVDEVLRRPDFADYQGRLHCMNHTVQPGEELDVALPDRVLSIVAYPSKTDLSDYAENGHLHWKSPSSGEEKVYVISTTASPELHPRYGQELVNVYFNRFEERLDAQGREGLNYFFQDELYYPLNIHSWCEDMREEFMRRKGYDILPCLPALWNHIGDLTPKIRLDYAQVVTELSEERYFKPIFDWHSERGLIYGCDNNGRGLNPLEYMDYFRAISWFTAPGNDAPARGSSFRQTKVSSSVAHLYERPRTWLEAFHSMGWNSNGEWLTSQLDLHLIAGGNLLCMHGLYYSTHGGWWEWAPPCFHFRMPYWPHMKHWLKYAERMCYLLSQGVHVCDIALLYPTESLQAYPGEADMSLFWKVADRLSECGMDYDFIDYQSLQRAETEQGQLHVSGERYKVLILADIKALHHETLQKIREFRHNGGILLFVGDLPKATTRAGENDPQVEAMLRDLSTGSRLQESDIDRLPRNLADTFTPDFTTRSGNGKVLHRRIGKRDVYMVMGVRRGEEIFFRCKGKVEHWNAKNGAITTVSILRQTEEGTWIRHQAEQHESMLYVFSAGEVVSSQAENYPTDYITTDHLPTDSLPLGETDWDIEIIPTMDNRWGDFRLPAKNEIIGPEAREIAYQFIPQGGEAADPTRRLTDKEIAGYAPYMETLTVPAAENLKQLLSQNLDEQRWKPYCYSWQYGVKDNPGSQGYHGLKGKVDNRFVILDKGGHQLFRTYVYATETRSYRIEQEGVKPDFCLIDGKPTDGDRVQMKKGWHRLLLAYADTPTGSYVLGEKKNKSIDTRERSAVVFYPADAPEPKEHAPYDSIVAMKWYTSAHLPYTPYGASRGKWIYQFETAPGTRTMQMQVNGKINQMWIDGKPLPMRQVKQEGAGNYLVELEKFHTSGIQSVTIDANPEVDCIGTAFFAQPVKMVCEGGRMPAGNWTDFGALKFFSGGINYTTHLDWDKPGGKGQIFLDLGSVNATCQVKVNGEEVDVLLNPPYRVDVSRYLKEGSNRIEVLVYSTLSNHYQTIPSAYRGVPVSGLLGPVKLLIYE